MLGKVFKAYDIRATYPKPLNEKLAWQIGHACAQYLTERAADEGYDDPMMRNLVVGRDMRQSSPALTEALCAGINDFGAHVIDLGMVDTPFVYFAINYLGCCGGVQTTASHNPANYNGFKISQLQAKPVGMDTGLDVIRRYAAMSDREKTTPAGGRSEQRDLWSAYREHVHRFLRPAPGDVGRELHVVIDASNGMAGTMVPKIFDGIPGLKISKLNFDNSTGEFKHEPNPLVEANLAELREAVTDQGAHFGVCFDGDADRLVVVDEKADVIGCDHLSAWMCSRFLESSPGSAVVYDLRSTLALPEIITEAGGRPVRSRVGHVFMKQALADNDAVFGGELSGHFYFRDNYNADSGAIALAVVISALCESDVPLSEQMAPARRYAQSGEINFETEDKEAAIDELVDAFPDAEIDELDGVTLTMNGWWCNVRPSNTEPLLRLNLEGPDSTTVERRVSEVSRYLGKRVDH
ncbi:MAG: phosphomannomutase/phosphoglucomutase [Planctomycetota bacterium]|jgi:phosphomannomutase